MILLLRFCQAAGRRHRVDAARSNPKGAWRPSEQRENPDKNVGSSFPLGHSREARKRRHGGTCGAPTRRSFATSNKPPSSGSQIEAQPVHASAKKMRGAKRPSSSRQATLGHGLNAQERSCSSTFALRANSRAGSSTLHSCRGPSRNSPTSKQRPTRPRRASSAASGPPAAAPAAPAASISRPCPNLHPRAGRAPTGGSCTRCVSWPRPPRRPRRPHPRRTSTNDHTPAASISLHPNQRSHRAPQPAAHQQPRRPRLRPAHRPRASAGRASPAASRPRPAPAARISPPRPPRQLRPLRPALPRPAHPSRWPLPSGRA